MRILNPAVEADLRAARPLRLNLGGGQRQKPGFYNVDCVALPGVDILADLEKPLSALPDNSVAAIYSRHVLEHISHFQQLIAELHRITQPGGQIEIIVPHFSNPYAYSDPTHVRFFGLYSFFYYAEVADQPRRKVPTFYTSVRFRVESVRLQLLKVSWLDKLARLVAQPLLNRGIDWMDWYERRLCRFFPIGEVRYVLHPVKSAEPAVAAA
ncbi:MAG: methyltransferase domain-containing protein [Gemmataceae bacterium]